VQRWRFVDEVFCVMVLFIDYRADTTINAPTVLIALDDEFLQRFGITRCDLCAGTTGTIAQGAEIDRTFGVAEQRVDESQKGFSVSTIMTITCHWKNSIVGRERQCALSGPLFLFCRLSFVGLSVCRLSVCRFTNP